MDRMLESRLRGRLRAVAWHRWLPKHHGSKLCQFSLWKLERNLSKTDKKTPEKVQFVFLKCVRQPSRYIWYAFDSIMIKHQTGSRSEKRERHGTGLVPSFSPRHRRRGRCKKMVAKDLWEKYCHWIYIIVVYSPTVVETLSKCTKVDVCKCSTDEGTIDLSSLAGTGSNVPRYSFHPCIVVYFSFNCRRTFYSLLCNWSWVSRPMEGFTVRLQPPFWKYWGGSGAKRAEFAYKFGANFWKTGFLQ